MRFRLLVHHTNDGLPLCGGEGAVSYKPRKVTCEECLEQIQIARRQRQIAAQAQEEIRKIMQHRQKKQADRIKRYNELHTRIRTRS